MLQFFNSISQNGRVNGQHIVFITGAEGVGKTDFIENVTNLFKTRKLLFSKNKKMPNFSLLHSPQSYENQQRQYLYNNQFCSFVKIDFQEDTLMTEQAFFDHFCEKILKEILRTDNEVRAKVKLHALDARTVFRICVSEYHPKYYVNLLKEELSSILNNTSLFVLADEEVLQFTAICQELSELIIPNSFSVSETYDSGVSFSQIQEIYCKIVKFFSKKQKCTELQSAIRLNLQIFSRLEWQNRPKVYEEMWYQSGIQRTEFLFNVLNHICGFGAMNREKVRNFIQNSQLPEKETYIDCGNHIDVVMVLQHLQHISSFGSEKFYKWFDYVIARLNNSSNLRSHFPIVIEIENSYQLEELRRLGKYQPDIPTVLELPGYFQKNIHLSNLPQVFDKKTIDRLFPVLGRNPSTWNQSVMQLINGTTLEELVIGSTPICKQKEIIFHSKINKLALFAENLPLIDQGKLKSVALLYLKLLGKAKGMLSNYNDYYDLSLFEQPDFIPLFKLNVVFKHFYHEAVDIVDSRYLFGIKAVTKQYLSRTPFLKREYEKVWRWLRRHGLIDFNRGFKYREVIYNKRWEKEAFRYNFQARKRVDFHLRDYFGSPQHYKNTYYENYIKDKYNL